MRDATNYVCARILSAFFQPATRFPANTHRMCTLIAPGGGYDLRIRKLRASSHSRRANGTAGLYRSHHQYGAVRQGCIVQLHVARLPRLDSSGTKDPLLGRTRNKNKSRSSCPGPTALMRSHQKLDRIAGRLLHRVVECRLWF